MKTSYGPHDDCVTQRVHGVPQGCMSRATLDKMTKEAFPDTDPIWYCFACGKSGQTLLHIRAHEAEVGNAK